MPSTCCCNTNSSGIYTSGLGLPFVTDWNVPAGETVEIQLAWEVTTSQAWDANQQFNYDAYIDWGDGTPLEKLVVTTIKGNTPYPVISHTYTNTDNYQLSIYGNFPAWNILPSSKPYIYGQLEYGEVGFKIKQAYRGLPNFNTFLAGEVGEIGTLDLYKAFEGTTGLTYFDFDVFSKSSRYFNLESAFKSCSNLVEVDTSTVGTPVEDGGMIVGYDPRSCFQYCTSLTTIHGHENWKWDSSRFIMNFFGNCQSLPTLDVRTWKMGVFDQAIGMFANCYALSSLDVSNWRFKTPSTQVWGNDQLTGSMFSACVSLSCLDVSNWNTENWTNPISMFYSCTKLGNVADNNCLFDVSGWDMGRCISLKSIFFNCQQLDVLDVSNWNITAVKSLETMFYNCKKLPTVDVSSWNTSAVTDMASIFRLCDTIDNLDVSNWNTSNVTTLVYIAASCTSLTEFDVSNWNTSKVTSCGLAFASCSSLINCDYSDWDLSKLAYQPTNPCYSPQRQGPFCGEFPGSGIPGPPNDSTIYPGRRNNQQVLARAYVKWVEKFTPAQLTPPYENNSIDFGIIKYDRSYTDGTYAAPADIDSGRAILAQAWTCALGVTDGGPIN